MNPLHSGSIEARIIAYREHIQHALGVGEHDGMLNAIIGRNLWNLSRLIAGATGQRDSKPRRSQYQPEMPTHPDGGLRGRGFSHWCRFLHWFVLGITHINQGWAQSLMKPTWPL